MPAKASAPLFSVIVPAFERQHLIDGCLESIVSQKRVDTEVLVVDNASADRTVEVTRGFSDRLDLRVLVNEQNRERSYSRNRGARAARGRFLVFLDSDDKLTPGQLDRAEDFTKANPDCRFFFQLIRIVDESGATVYKPFVRSRWEMRQTLAEGNPLSCSGVYIEPSLFLQHRFDEHPDLVGSEDWHCWIRVASECEPSLCPGDGALLLDHGARTVALDPWQRAEHRFAQLTADLLASASTRNYLAPFLGLFLGSQAHYVAVKAAGQLALRPSVAFFIRAIRHHPPLLATRRTLHLWRLWLRAILRPARRRRPE